MPRPDPGFGDAERRAAAVLIDVSLTEDLGERGDVTTAATIDGEAEGRVRIVAREAGVVAGLPVAAMVCDAVDGAIGRDVIEDGTPVSAGDCVATLCGPVRSLLTAERTALNFLTHLSGIATLASRYVAETAGTPARVLDTRKTLPGWRRLAKYAARCGGAANHRMGLYDMVLIKDNHIAAWRERHPDASLAAILEGVRNAAPQTLVMVEVDTAGQLEQLLSADPPPDFVMLDNMTEDQLRAAVATRNRLAPSVRLEASGGVTLETVGGIARTGVDRISVGAITHSAPNFDLGFDWVSGDR